MQRKYTIALIVVIAAVAAGFIMFVNLRNAGLFGAIGMVRETQIRVAPEMNGRLESIAVTAGQHVRKGDRLAVLSSPELEAAVREAETSADRARADRSNVLAGVRQEQRDISAQNVRIAESNLTYARQRYSRAEALSSKDVASKQEFDETTALLRKAESNLAALRALDERNRAGPTKEEIAAAEAKVALADAVTASLRAKLYKTQLTASADGVIGGLVGATGEVISPGQPVMTLTADGQRWISFTMREDRLKDVRIGAVVPLVLGDGTKLKGRVTELRPLGEFATWRAARAAGDHDLNSFLVRVDPVAGEHLDAGMSVWLADSD